MCLYLDPLDRGNFHTKAKIDQFCPIQEKFEKENSWTVISTPERFFKFFFASERFWTLFLTLFERFFPLQNARSVPNGKNQLRCTFFHTNPQNRSFLGLELKTSSIGKLQVMFIGSGFEEGVWITESPIAIFSLSSWVHGSIWRVAAVDPMSHWAQSTHGNISQDRVPMDPKMAGHFQVSAPLSNYTLLGSELYSTVYTWPLTRIHLCVCQVPRPYQRGWGRQRRLERAAGGWRTCALGRFGVNVLAQTGR